MPRTPNYEVIATVRNRIVSGLYDAAGFLPAERELAEELGVGRGVVRNVLRTLQDEGLIRLIPRRGAGICTAEKKQRLERFFIRCGHSPAVMGNAPEFLGVLGGICAGAAECCAEALLSLARDGDFTGEIISRWRRNELQGVIFIENTDTPGQLRELAAAGVPTVVANLESALEAVSTRMDFRAIGRAAGARLAAAGRGRVGAVTGPLDRYIYSEMLAGFRGALAEEELMLDRRLVVEFTNDPAGAAVNYRRLSELLASPGRPDAIFAMRDNRAEVIFRICRELRLRIPEDLAVIGYDDVSWPGAEAAGLTTLRQPVEILGRAAVELLGEYFLTGVPPECRVISPIPIERTSLPPPRRR